jgi:multiple sugar transport system substrate-binding protein
MIRLRALGWDHPRCMRPMHACSEAWQRRTGISITWDLRSLTSFGDQPLEELVHDYDLVVIDYPFAGAASASGVLRPLDELLDPETLEALAADSVGPSHDSYRYEGHQWGLATDAACHVSATQGRDPPRTWEDAFELARAERGRVALPLSPPHAISSFLTLCRGRFTERDVAEPAFELLAELHALGPREATDWEPPETLARLEAGELVYVPLTYGYVTYRCRFADVPGVAGSVLGGAGLAVTSASAHPDEAAAFAAWASGADAQAEYVVPNGGQPGSRSAWLGAAHPFFRDTLATLEQAWIRPRDPWWPPFQLEGGRVLTEALRARRSSGPTLDALDSVRERCVRRYG